MSLMQFLKILRARAGLVAAIVLVLVAVVATVTLSLPKRYEAQASVLVNPLGSNDAGSSGSSQHEDPVTTQADIIASYGVSSRVVERLHLAQRPHAMHLIAASGPLHKLRVFLTELLPGEASRQPSSIKDWLATQLLQRLSVHSNADSRVIKVAYSSPDPAFSAEVANGFVQAYLHNVAQVGAEPMSKTTQLFDQQLATLQQRLKQAQQNLSRFEQQKGIVNSGQGMDAEGTRLAALSAQLVDVQSQDYQARAKQRHLEEFIAAGAPPSSVPPEVLDSPAVMQSQQQMVQDQADLNALSRRVGPNHPLYKAAEAKLRHSRAAYRQQMLAAARGLLGNVSTSGDQVASLRAEVERQRRKVLRTKSDQARLAVLQSEVDNASQAYNAAAQRLAQTRMQGEAARNASAAVLDAATPPLQPASPKVPLILGIALLTGLALGIGAALWAEINDRRVRSQADVVELLGLPVLAVLGPRTNRRWAGPRLREANVPRLAG